VYGGEKTKRKAEKLDMKFAFVYVQGRLARLAETRAGHAAREFFYGALELLDRG
jgi:hypothetical protein